MEGGYPLTTADTVVIYPPQSDIGSMTADPTTSSKASHWTAVNTHITSAEEAEDLGEGERQGEGKRDELSWSGKKGGISKILEKPLDKEDQVSCQNLPHFIPLHIIVLSTVANPFRAEWRDVRGGYGCDNR